jgi:hypothetical protein
MRNCSALGHYPSSLLLFIGRNSTPPASPIRRKTRSLADEAKINSEPALKSIHSHRRHSALQTHLALEWVGVSVDSDCSANSNIDRLW